MGGCGGERKSYVLDPPASRRVDKYILFKKCIFLIDFVYDLYTIIKKYI